MARQSVLNTPNSFQFVTGSVSYVDTGINYDTTKSFSLTIDAYIIPPFQAINTIFGDLGFDIGIGYNVSGKVFAFHRGNNSTTSYTTTTSGQPDYSRAWHTFGYTFDVDSGLLSLYVDGVLWHSIATVGTYLNNNNNFTISSTSSTHRFNGYACNARFYNSALSASEMLQIAKYGVIPRSKLLGEYMTNGGVNDTSGNSQASSNNGATLVTATPYRFHKLLQEDRCSLNFVNATDNITLPVISGIDVSTFSYWSRIKVIGSGSLQTIVGPLDGVTNVPLWRVNASNFLELTKHGVTIIGTATTALNKGQWYDVGVTYNGTTGAYVFYANGQIVGSGTNLQTFSFSARQLGTHGTGTEPFIGRMCRFGVANTVLTQQEMLNITNGILPTSTVVNYALNTGAGTIAYDGAVANNGTITGATWNADKMFGGKKQYNGNLVKNGDLSYLPVVNVVGTTSSSTWMDGTTAGSSSFGEFGWKFYRNAGTIVSWDGIFDTTTLTPTGRPTIKMTAYDATGNGFCDIGAGIAATVPLGNLRSAIPVLPNTSYTLTAWVKTDNVPTNGAFTQMTTYDGAGTRFDNAASTRLTGTNDWTKITQILVTNASARFMTIGLMRNVGGQACTAWFGDVQCRPTSPLVPNTRKQVGGNLVYNGNLQYVPTGTIPTTTVSTWINGSAAGSATQDEYGWYLNSFATANSTAFEVRNGRNTLRVSNTNTTGRTIVGSANALTPATYAGGSKYKIPLLPNTSYTISAGIETYNVPASGVWVTVVTFNGDNTTRVEYDTARLTGTNERSVITSTFTTGASTGFGYILLRNAVAGNICDAWFDSITLTPTSNTVRTQVS